MEENTIAGFISSIQRKGIRISLKDNELDIKAPKGVMTKEILIELKQKKPQIIDYLGGVSLEHSGILPITNLEDHYPISDAQRRLWILSQVEEGSVAYNLPSTNHLNQNIDIDVFKQAINATIERHEILRTVFKENEQGEVRQWVLKFSDFNFEIDYKDFRTEEDKEQAVNEYIRIDSFQPFDLANGPLLRAALLHVENDAYVFYHNMHHIVSDEWSMKVMSEDIFNYYEAIINGTTPALPPLKIQYKDYSVWQLQQLEEKSYKSHSAYWMDKLAGTLPLFNLPGANKRPKVKSYNGFGLTTVIDADATAKLRKFTNERGGSMFMGVLAAWNALMYRYTLETDFIIGSPVAGRDHIDLEDQIGFYVNTLALRNTIDPNENFDQLFKRVKENTLKAYDHQMYPFDRLVNELNLKRDTSRSVVFDISMTYHNIGEDVTMSQEEGEKRVNKIFPTEPSKVKMDIELHFKELGDYLSFGLIYNQDIYDRTIIERLMNHFGQMLKALLSDSNELIGSVNFLNEEEVNELLVAFNETNVDFPKNETLVSLFEKQVEKTPDSVALIFGEERMTYKELDKKSNQIAQTLVDNYEIGAEDLVGIQLDRNQWMVVAILGVMKAGAVYVPIDPEYPASRKEFIINDSNVKLLITESLFIYDIDYYEGEIFAIDVEFDETKTDEKVELSTQDNHLAYVIYTSGSTGKPKGVMVEHKAIVNTMFAQMDAFEVNPSSVGLQFASFSFDASISELFTILLSGGRLALASDQDRKDPSKLIALLNKHEVNVATLPPSLLSKIDLKSIESLTHLITAGEAPNYEKALEFAGQGTYLNAYGPTEASICGAIFNLSKEDNPLTHTLPIGRPISNASIYILSEELGLQPQGVTGEICIGGAGLARGYLNREDLTSEKFITNPFNEGERIYRTGDLGRWLSDGTIEFLGRKDDQVKIRGYRVELGEIEHSLLGYEGINSVVVLAKTNKEGEKELVAYLTSTVEQNTSDLRGYLQQELPAYMLPSHFVQLETLPLTANGKVDKKALPDPEGMGLSSGVEYIAPRTTEEKVLVSVWEAVLKREEIGVKDSFYNLGGDSIKSIQVVARLRQQGYALKVEHILQTPVLEELVGFMETSLQEVDQSAVTGLVELTPIQHWFFTTDEVSHHGHFNQSVLLSSKTALDSEALNQSLAKLTEHHDALRMVYVQTEEGWEQTNKGTDHKGHSLDYYDLSDSENPVAQMAEIGEQLQSTISLTDGPLVRAVHFTLPDGDRLGLIIHHLVVDGVSWRILLEDLGTLYAAYSQGETPALPLKTDAFQKWAAAQKEYAGSKALLSEKVYWNTLCETVVDPLPTDKSETTAVIDSRVSFSLDAATTDRLQTQVHGVYNTEINDILLTGLGLAIKEALSTDKVVLKMEGHGREDILEGVDISRTVGWFTSVYPFVLDVSGSGDRLHHLVGVKESLRKVPNKGVGYGILKHLGEEPLKGELTPEVVFNYLGDFGTAASTQEEALFEYASERIGSESSDQNKNETKLEVTGILAMGELDLTLSYSGECFTEEIMGRVAQAYEENLKELIQSLSEIKETYPTPSDLSFKGLTQEELSWMNPDNSLEDVYELSPLQEGIFYHWLFEASTSEYFEQTSYRVRAKNLEIEKLEKAYNDLISRHPVLRTSFTNDYAGRSLQVVRKQVKGSFIYEKMENRSDKQGFVDHIKQNDREEGFDLTDPSQMRLYIVQLDEDEYEFIWSHHHILMDGWCMGVLINDFNELLSAEVSGQTATLSKTRPYADYISWLKEIDKEASLSYWNDYLEGIAQITEVPFRKQSKDPEFVQATETFQIAGEAFEKMQTLCTDLGVTQNTFIQGVWGYLMALYNSSKDVVFGTVVSGRPADLKGVEEMIGLFINTIPVRVQFELKDTPAQLLKKIQKESIESKAHHYLNLSEVQAQSSLGMNLINHIMAFENYVMKEMDNEGVLNTEKQEEGIFVESVEVFEQTNYDLTVTVAPTDKMLELNIVYDENRYDKEAMGRIGTHFSNLVNGFLDNKLQSLDTLEYLSDDEKKEQLVELNQTTFTPDEEDLLEGEKSVLELISQQSQKNPEQKAIVFEAESLTYGELEARSNQLADYLNKNYAVTTDNLVGIKMEKGIELIVSILGVLKAGGAYVPIDPLYPEDRIVYIEKDSGIKTLLTTEEYKKFEDSRSQYDNHYRSTPESGHLAYTIYTSGSTGKPKGVMVEHEALLNLCAWHKNQFSVTQQDVATLYAGVAFDASVWELFPYLISGATLHIIPAEVRLDMEALNAYYQSHGVTISFLPTQIAERFMDQDNDSLRVLLVGGDKLNVFKTKKYEVFNNYGPTESAVVATSCAVKADVSGLPIGTPVSNTRVYLLSDSGKLQAKGVVGELCIAGKGLARGYHNQPDLTREKFVDNPVVPGERLYKTNDLAKWRTDGLLEFVGRKDSQLKIRGYRIEPGEIEFALLQHQSVEEALVLARDKDGEGKELVAYVVPKQELTISDLRNDLRKVLPAYMVPGYYVLLDEFPLNRNGKIDREALPTPNDLNALNSEAYVAPRNEVEEKLVEIWEMVLGRKKIGVKDDFFNIGGHSLRAMGLVVEYKNSFNVNLKLQDIYDRPQIEAHAELIDVKKWIKEDQPEENVVKDDMETFDF